MQLKQLLKKIFPFRKRELDWWTFLLLPLFLIFLFSPVIFLVSKNLNQILILFTQQLLFFSIIISATDLGVKFKSKFKSEREYIITYPLLLMLIALISLVCLYMIIELIINLSWLKYVYLFWSVFITFLSVLLYNRNPETFDFGSKQFVQMKEKQEQKAQETFKAPKKKNKFNKIKWGEQDE